MLARILALMGSLRITVAGLSLLLILTVWGTLYQADHGLYEAQGRFYQSWSFFIARVIPFPGAQTVMTALFINLAASIGSLSLQRRLRAGYLITHLGLALMLLAGGVTFYFGSSGHLTLAEGEASNVAVADGEWEVAIMPADDGIPRVVNALDIGAFRPGRRVPLLEGQTTLVVEDSYRNCSRSGTLRRLPPAGDPRENLPGLVLKVEQPGQSDQRLFLWAGDTGPTPMATKSGRITIGIRPWRLPLPAVIELVDFRREFHPGSRMARSYSSQVVVRAGEGSGRKVLISMNKPLRLKDFTFYQSSFASGTGGRDTSTLAVVRNVGRRMPYIATGLTAAGMLLHFAGMLLVRLRRHPPKASP